MSETFAEEVYYSMVGSTIPKYMIPGVKDEYAEGEYCCDLYAAVYDANLRLCKRLGVSDEDDDVETIVSNMFAIQKHLCLKIYEYGAIFGASK